MVEETEFPARTIEVDRERCVRCGECVDACPQSGEVQFPVYVRNEEGFPEVANIESCIGCLSCEDRCRALAIEVRGEKAGGRETLVDPRAEVKGRAMF